MKKLILILISELLLAFYKVDAANDLQDNQISITAFVFYDWGYVQPPKTGWSEDESVTYVKTQRGGSFEHLWCFSGTITKIPSEAFKSSPQTGTIKFPSSIKEIGDGAFRASSDATIILPDGLTKIGVQAFQNSSISHLEVGRSLKEIGTGAFGGCSNLSNLSISEESPISIIPVFCFMGCSKIQTITIPKDVTFIGYRAFADCSALKDIICYPVNPPTTDNDVFDNTSISTATLHVPAKFINIYKSTSPWSNFGSIVPIEDDTYIYNNGICYKLTSKGAEVTSGDKPYTGSVEIPASVIYKGKNYSVTDIDAEAFSGCTQLTSITIPYSIKNIGENAFSGCSSLKKVIVSDLKAWCAISFNGIEANPLSKSHHLFCNEFTEVIDLVIPDDVKTICSYSFLNCTSLTSVTIPNSVTSIGDYSFYACSNLASFTVGSGVNYIGNNAFKYCSSLNKVIVPNIAEWCGITFSSSNANPLNIACRLFYDETTEITDLVIPQGVISIGDYAFRRCNRLNSITIPESVTSIAEASFEGCTGLTDVYCYAENVPSTYSNAFKNSSISSATLHVPEGSVDSYKTTKPWSLFGNIVALTQDEIDSIRLIESHDSALSKGNGIWYDLNGRYISAEANSSFKKGINIIRYPDGTTRKVMKKIKD